MIRDFQCDCGRSVQDDQVMDTISYPICSECGEVMKQRFYPVPVTFKGSGWARKDK